jgi:membrane fusion protein (multidrug efflux system)
MNAVVHVIEPALLERPALAPAPAAAPVATPVAKALGARLARHRTLLAVGVGIALALGGAALILAPARSESTDDAYVGVDATSIAPKVHGLVSEVLVRENQAVHAGDALLRIDAEEYNARAASAVAALADAAAGVAAAKAAIGSLAAEDRLAAANVVAARATTRSAEAQAERAKADTQRYDSLIASGAVARQLVDKARADAVSAQQDAARAAAQVGVAEASSGIAAARRPLLEAALLKAQAAVARAQSDLELARQDQRHTVITAPIDGVVGNRQVQQGDYVQPGTRLLTLVPVNTLYVTAHFKETQTGRMHAGAHVTVKVDALSGRTFTGVVDSLAPGSGSEFALLPFEPGTGNFTKIVQRVPVRIRFDAGQEGLAALRPGLSATARVTLDR